MHLPQPLLHIWVKNLNLTKFLELFGFCGWLSAILRTCYLQFGFLVFFSCRRNELSKFVQIASDWLHCAAWRSVPGTGGGHRQHRFGRSGLRWIRNTNNAAPRPTPAALSAQPAAAILDPPLPAPGSSPVESSWRSSVFISLQNLIFSPDFCWI